MEPGAALRLEDIVTKAMLTLSALALLAVGACLPDNTVGSPTGGGASGTAAPGGNGMATGGGGGGQSPGTAGAGGTTGAAGSSVNPAGGGGTTGTAGSTGVVAGTGGAPTGWRGRGGARLAAGIVGPDGAERAAAAGRAAGSSGRGGAGTRAAARAAQPAARRRGDEFVSGVSITVHPQTTTILVVTWTQAKAADQTWLEFTFTGGSRHDVAAAAGATGAHRDVVLGVPGSTAVTVRIVNKLGGVDYKTKDYQGMTGALPSGMPKPTVSMYDAALASPDRWMFGAVENSRGGCNNIVLLLQRAVLAVHHRPPGPGRLVLRRWDEQRHVVVPANREGRRVHLD